MATTKTTTPRKRTTKSATAKSATPRATTAKPRAATTKPATKVATAKKDDSLVARTGRTIKAQPYTSAAIATGAVTVVAAAAAGAYLMTRRDKSFKEASGELASKVKGSFASASETVKEGFATASETVKDGIAGASDTIKDLAERGTGYFKGDGGADDIGTGDETRTQQQIAEEALTLKETGAVQSPVDKLSATEIKTGAIAY